MRTLLLWRASYIYRPKFVRSLESLPSDWLKLRKIFDESVKSKYQDARGGCRFQQTSNDSSRTVPTNESSHHHKAATGSTGVLFISFYCYYYTKFWIQCLHICTSVCMYAIVRLCWGWYDRGKWKNAKIYWKNLKPATANSAIHYACDSSKMMEIEISTISSHYFLWERGQKNILACDVMNEGRKKRRLYLQLLLKFDSSLRLWK